MTQRDTTHDLSRRCGFRHGMARSWSACLRPRTVATVPATSPTATILVLLAMWLVTMLFLFNEPEGEEVAREGQV